MKKKRAVAILMVSLTLLTGCDKSQLNPFNYAHKEPELDEDTNYSSTIKDILEGYSDGNKEDKEKDGDKDDEKDKEKEEGGE